MVLFLLEFFSWRPLFKALINHSTALPLSSSNPVIYENIKQREIKRQACHSSLAFFCLAIKRLTMTSHQYFLTEVTERGVLKAV